MQLPNKTSSPTGKRKLSTSIEDEDQETYELNQIKRSPPQNLQAATETTRG